MRTTFDRDATAVVIGGNAWRGWDDLELHFGLDTHPTVGFSAPFDPARADFREVFRPFSFKPLGLTIGGEPLFTGTLVEVIPRSEADSTVVSCNGYSLPGVLEDCNLPAAHVPFEASGLTLSQIAQRLAGFFGLSVVQFDGGGPFHRVKTRSRSVDTRADHDTRIDGFLVELAKQRGFVRTSNARGQLVFWQSVKPGNPVANLVEGAAAMSSVVPTFNGQDYYSEITGFTSVKRGRTGSKFTQRNERLSGGVLRSMSFRLDDVEKGDAAAAVKAKVGRMFANCVSYVVNLPGWRNPRGDLWQPNTTITLDAPSAMIYAPTEMLVRDVILREKATEKTTSLGLVLPGVFSGEIPARMPWEDP